MRVTRKYEYKLTEKSLSEDLDKFFEEARNGNYHFDHRYGMEGLRIIRQYFKLLNREFEEKNYVLCIECYKKLLLFLFEGSSENNYFDYEDLLARTKLDFDDIVGRYIHLLIQNLPLDGFFQEYLIFVKGMQDYGFESIKETIFRELDEKSLLRLEELLTDKLKSFDKKEYWMYELVYLLLGIYKKLKLKEKYVAACKTFSYASEEFSEMIDEYEDVKRVAQHGER
jgi:hypothetical protein